MKEYERTVRFLKIAASAPRIYADRCDSGGLLSIHKYVFLNDRALLNALRTIFII